MLLLPETDEAGALRIAVEVHAQVRTVTVGSVGIGAVTVSIGLASGIADAGNLYGRADAALYEAKAGGRNQTRSSSSAGAQLIERQALRVVGG